MLQSLRTMRAGGRLATLCGGRRRRRPRMFPPRRSSRSQVEDAYQVICDITSICALAITPVGPNLMRHFSFIFLTLLVLHWQKNTVFNFYTDFDVPACQKFFFTKYNFVICYNFVRLTLLRIRDVFSGS